MKVLQLLFVLGVICLEGFAWAVEEETDLPTGHWRSEKVDEETSELVTFENWFEKDPVEGRVYKFKELRRVALPKSPPSSVPDQPAPQLPASDGPWVCYANDYVSGHDEDSAKSEDCVQAYYRGKGQCKEDAVDAALKSCRQNSKNRATCTLQMELHCFSPKNFNYLSK